MGRVLLVTVVFAMGNGVVFLDSRLMYSISPDIAAWLGYPSFELYHGANAIAYDALTGVSRAVITIPAFWSALLCWLLITRTPMRAGPAWNSSILGVAVASTSYLAIGALYQVMNIRLGYLAERYFFIIWGICLGVPPRT